MEKAKINSLPDLPGIYIFKNKSGEIIYIGKANSIRKRVKEHFVFKNKSPKESSIISETKVIDFVITASEPEAILLESYLIKEEQPRYNIIFRDDKTFPCVKVTLEEEYPSIFITRRKIEDGSLYLGPYPNVKKLRLTLKILRAIFPFRSCRHFPKSLCLYYHLNLCLAPCVIKIDRNLYRKNILAIIKALLGDLDGVIKDLTSEMDACVQRNEFEQAAVIRDKIKALGKVKSLFGRDESISTSESIRKKLNLPHLPRVIDGVDVSNISGTSAAGSVVRFRDGEWDKNFYRRFKLKKQDFINDYEMMAEVVLRRYKEAREAKEQMPDLIILDGGKGHLNFIDKVLKKDLNLNLSLIAYAKGKDVIFSKHKKGEIKFATGSSEKNLLQRVRDEAHRFAIGYHKLLRGKKMKQSIFEGIPGIGEIKLKSILSQFEDLENLSPQNLKKIKGIGNVLAERIYNHFKKKETPKTS